MRLAEKARENFEAVDRLLDTHDGEVEALANAAVSRAYYAAYQAVVDRVQRTGLQLPTGSGHYRHDLLPDHAFHSQILTHDLRESLVWLRDLRVKADYLEDQVEYDEASAAFERAKQVVEAVLTWEQTP
jgi:uncharacterized protein (UPF0332 family)